MSAAAGSIEPLKRTPLFDLHLELGAKMVPFAGYDMPVQYPLGVLKEHLWTREKAGLFDVSHMGFGFADGPSHAAIVAALETLMPADFANLPLGKIRYSQLLNDDGGIIDDLMVTRSISTDDDGGLLLVVNASRKEIDIAHMNARLPAGCKAALWPRLGVAARCRDRAPPMCWRKHAPAAAALAFMTASAMTFDGLDCHISRSGYTGEDGFEIAVPAKHAEQVARTLLARPRRAADRPRRPRQSCGSKPASASTATTSTRRPARSRPISCGRCRSGGGRKVAFQAPPASSANSRQGPRRKRVGIKPDGRQPAREGTKVLDAAGREVGVITSGGFGPSVNGPVAMGYVDAAAAAVGTPLQLIVRDKPLAGLGGGAAVPSAPVQAVMRAVRTTSPRISSSRRRPGSVCGAGSLHRSGAHTGPGLRRDDDSG